MEDYGDEAGPTTSPGIPGGAQGHSGMGPNGSPPRRYTDPPRMMAPGVPSQDISRNMYGYSNDGIAMAPNAVGQSQILDS